MPTFQERYATFKLTVPNTKITGAQRSVIAHTVSNTFKAQFPKKKLPKVASVEKRGTFQVTNYPDTFIPTMDKIISEAYTAILNTPPEPEVVKQEEAPIVTKKLRKRIPAKPVKINY